MKILITSELYKGTVNGVATSVKNLEKHLLKLGHEVKILSASEKAKSYKEDNAYYIKSLPTRIYKDIRMPITIRHRYLNELVKWSPDIIHTQSEFFTFEFAKYIRKHTNAKLVHTYHTHYEQYANYFPFGHTIYKTSFRPWIKKRLSKCDVVIAPTKKVLNILEEYGVSSVIKIVPSGINIEAFYKDKSPEEIAKKREELGIRKEQKVLIVLSRLGFEKKVSELVIGLRKTLEKNDKYILLIVGDGPARTDLQDLAKNLKIDNRIIFTGMIEPENVPLYYQLADLYMSASTSETQGLTFVEALASGLPLLCKKDDCLNGLIFEDKNGYIYEDIDDIARLVEKVFVNKLENNTISREIAYDYGIEKFGERVNAIYEELMEK